MTKYMLANPIASATGVVVAALVAALATFFVFGAKDAGAQSQSIEVKPSTLKLDQVALGSTDSTSVKITNDGSSDVEIGGINFSGSGAEVLKLVDKNTGEEFVVDAATGLLKALDPATGLLTDTTIDIGKGEDRVFDAVFRATDPGTGGDQIPIDGTLQFLNSSANTVLGTASVIGQGRQCTIQGTEGDDTLISDTPADEVICGLGGNDTIDATAGGDDTILGGPGDDTVNMKDGVRKEYANGGSGKDLCNPKDKKDKIKSCGTKQRK